MMYIYNIITHTKPVFELLLISKEHELAIQPIKHNFHTQLLTLNVMQ